MFKLKRHVSLIFCAMYLLCFSLFGVLVSPLKVNAATIVTYTKPAYTNTSSIFSLTADSNSVLVEDYMDYHYAHFSYSGTSSLTVTASQNITSFDISPHSLGITGTVSGNNLTFSIDSSSIKPYYLIIQINSLEKLVILADPIESNVPASSGTGIYNIRNSPYNADNTWTNDVTSKIQQAIDDASAAGGGIVYVPTGVYKVKEIIYMKSNVTLYLQGGAVIRSNTDRSQYTPILGEDSGTYTLNPMIRIDNAPNSKILGRGVIDASGIALMDKNSSSSTYLQYRRNVIVGTNSNNVTVEGIIIKDATTWTFRAIEGGDGFIVRNIKIINHKNVDQYKIMNDGIDICATRNAIAEKNFVMTVDDAMCAKSSIANFDMYNVHFKNNIVFTSCAGVKAGMQARSPMYDIWFEDNDVVQARRGIVAEATSGNQLMSDIHFVNTRVESFVNTSAGTSKPIEIFAETAPISNVYIEGAVFEKFGDAKSNIRGKSNTLNVNTVNIKNLYMIGNIITNITDGQITDGSYATGITIASTSSQMFSDNFNSYATGSQPTGWTVTNAANTSATIEEIPSAADKSLKIYDNNTSGYTKVNRAFTAQSGKIRVAFTFMEPTPGTWTKFQLMSGSTVGVLLSTSSTGPNLVYKDSSGTDVIIQSISANTYYNVVIIADPSTDKCDIYVNGVLKAVGTQFRNAVSSLNSMEFQSGATPTGTTYISTAQVKTAP